MVASKLKCEKLAIEGAYGSMFAISRRFGFNMKDLKGFVSK
jgi:hypothetical protein